MPIAQIGRLRATATAFLIAASWVLSSGSGALEPLSTSEFYVNTYTTDLQSEVRIEARADGRFVVVWESRGSFYTGPDGAGNAIRGRVFGSDGAPLAPDFVVNSYTTADERLPDLAMDAAGNFVVVWVSPADGSSLGIAARRFDANGAPIGSEFVVNTYTPYLQAVSAIAAAPDGRFVVAWQDGGPFDHLDGLDGDEAGIFARVYDSSTTPLGPQFAVNTYTTGRQSGAAVAMHDDGSFVVVWKDAGLGDGDGTALRARRFDASATALGTEFQVNSSTTGSPNPVAVAHTPGNGFVVTWVEQYVRGQRFDAVGAPIGTEFLTATSLLPTTSAPVLSIDAADDGRFVVVWRSVSLPAAGADTSLNISGQRYASDGTPAGTEFVVNTYRQIPHQRADVAVSDTGFVVSWTAPRRDSGDDDVVAARVCVDDDLDTDGDGIGDSCDPCADSGAGGLIGSPKLRLKAINTNQTLGDDRLQLSGEFVLPMGWTFATIDPLSSPMRIRLETTLGAAFVDVTLPTAPLGAGTRGWTSDVAHTKWTFIDKTSTPSDGIIRVTLKDGGSGLVRLRVKGKGGVYGMLVGDEPLHATLVFGDGAAGECVQTAFSAADCRFSGLDSTFSCRQ